MTTITGGLQQLRERVLDTGLCTLCGACSGLCPYLRPFQGRVAVMDSCPVTDSRCLSFCPRSDLDLDAASQQIHGVPYSDEPLGEVRRVVMARSSNPEVQAQAQGGGTVATLASLALKRGTISKAVLTQSENGTPRGVVVTSPEEVLACRGSEHVAAPTLEAFNRVPPGPESLGVVGTPCQVQALAKMRASPLAGRSNIGRLVLTIGLFCRGRRPDEARTHVLDACRLCPDLTAELADLSVGAAERIEGWDTVLIRSEGGEALVEKAVGEGLLETDSLPQSNLDRLIRASRNKKRGALNRIRQRTGRQEDLLFLRLRPEVVSRLLQT